MAKKFGDGSGDNYSSGPHTRLYNDGQIATIGAACAAGGGVTYHTEQQQQQVVGNNPNFNSTTTITTHMACPPPPPPPYRHHHRALQPTGGDTTNTLVTLPGVPFISMNAMERSNTEPLLAEEEFSELLRDNSLLNRTGSGIFQQLIAEPPQPLHIQMTQQDHQYAQQIPEVVQIEQRQPQLQQHLQTQELIFPPNLQLSSSLWDNLGEVEELELEDGSMSVALGPSSDVTMMSNDNGITMTEGWSIFGQNNNNSTPSIVAWPGRYAFQISMPTDNKERNKWCFSTIKSKLYVCPLIAVPVSVTVNEWISEGSITITPVYSESRHMMIPVGRCFNCKSKNIPVGEDETIEEHVVQVEGEGQQYEFVGKRHQVSVPLQPPQMGELASTILVKVMCLQTCNGGPNRRPFVLVFTLKNKNGEEIGRQILDVKCCKCPSRDMKNDEEKQTGPNGRQAPRLDDEKRAKVRKLASEIVVGQQKKRPRIKLEPGTQTQFVNVMVPVQFEKNVKSYVNQLMAAEYTKQTNPQVMMYSESEDSN